MNTRKAFCALSAAAIGSILAGNVSATTVAQWSFTAKMAAPDNSPAPTTGTGTSISLGMTNNYVYSNGEGPGSVTNDDITSVTGATSAVSEFTWRIRGNSNATNSGPGKANGWNNSAPNYTQGAEFAVPTTGYSNIGVSFDWYSTTQGVGNMQFLYSLDGTSFTPLGSDYIAASSDFYNNAATEPNISIDLSAIPGASNDANFAIEMVSVKPVPGDSDYSATGPGGDGNYASAAGDTDPSTAVDYNNNSGNWSFNNITVTGTVPEPASAALLGLGSLSLLARRRK